MISKRIIFSWIISSIVMFGISYAWHGLFLNDVANLNYPLGIYLISSSIVYLVIGFVLVKIFTSVYAIAKFRNFIVRGLACGAATGLVLYMIALVLGISFTKNTTLSSILVDVPWQVFEQTLGGFSIGIVYTLIFDPMPFRSSENRV